MNENFKGKDRQDLLDRFDQCYAHLENYVPPDPLFSVKIPGIHSVMCMPSGGIVGVAGVEGARKTTLLKSFVLSYFSSTGQFGFIECNSKKKKGVLWVDTELGETTFLRHQQEIRDFLRMEDKKEGGNRELLYKFGSIMDLGTAELKHAAFEELLELYSEGHIFDEIDFVVLDGIADLSPNVNDEGMSKSMIDSLVAKLQECGVGLLTAIHVTKVSHDPRGNLGAHLKQKADTIFKLTYDRSNPDVTYVSKIKTRHGPFQPFLLDGNSVDSISFIHASAQQIVTNSGYPLKY